MLDLLMSSSPQDIQRLDSPRKVLSKYTAPRNVYGQRAHKRMSKLPQKLLFNAATGNAFTTVLAGLAFTIITCPKHSLLPALVAGFTRVLMRHKPGMVNNPALFTCSAPMPARLLTIFMHSDFLISVSVASASARPPLVMGFFPPAFIAFMAFM